MADVWDRATEFLSDNLGTVTPIALLLILVPTSIISNLMPLIATSNRPTVLMVQLAVLLLAIVSLAGQLAIVALALEPARTVRAAMAIALARLLPTIAVIATLVFGGLLLNFPALALLMAHGVDPRAILIIDAAGLAGALPPSIAWILAAWVLLVVAVFIWVSARLVVIYPVIVAEQITLRALLRSFRLTQRLTLAIVGVLILYKVVSEVMALAAKTVFGSILAIIAGAGGSGDPDLATVLTAVIVAAVATAFTVLGTAFTAKLYLALRGVPAPAAPAV